MKDKNRGKIKRSEKGKAQDDRAKKIAKETDRHTRKEGKEEERKEREK